MQAQADFVFVQVASHSPLLLRALIGHDSGACRSPAEILNTCVIVILVEM